MLKKQFYFIWVMVISLSSCAFNHQNVSWVNDQSQCAELITRVNQSVSSERVRDIQASQIEGFPMLRTNRFWTSFANNLADDSDFDFWLHQAESLALEGWSVELKNLSVDRKSEILSFSRRNFGVDSVKALHQCVDQTHAFRLKHRSKIIERMHVPDDYQSWKRFLGGYFISAWPFLAGVHSWHEEARARFKSSISKQNSTLVYAPVAISGSKQAVASNWFKLSQHNPLGVPFPDLETISDLFAIHAPSIEIVSRSASDHIGEVVWADEKIQVNTEKPTVYTLLSRTRFEQKTLLQLNYIFWFPSRPKSSTFDLLGGHLDGLIWRVTLDTDGQPLLYDSIHPCGCYHMFFPTDRLCVLADSGGYEEGALIPQRITNRSETGRLHLLIESSSHYLSGVKNDGEQAHAIAYQSRPYGDLRHINVHGNTKSMFGDDGLVAGSERGERFFFWPMGIDSPGAMRQWGHHATEFVGRRHFDDPLLIQRYFIRKPDRLPGVKGNSNPKTKAFTTKIQNQCLPFLCILSGESF